VTPLLAAILAVAINTAHVTEWVIEDRVVGVSDGDTITLLDRDNRQHKIRLAGIDAPENGRTLSERSGQNRCEINTAGLTARLDRLPYSPS
jgi:endonuclease YncB( thermonuclease family)